MQPLLNQLLDEASGRAVELTHETEEALRGVDALAQRAGEIESRIGAEGAEARQSYGDLHERLQQAATRVEAAGEAAAEAFDDG